MKVIKISTNSIKLGQFLKLLGCISTGGEAKFFLNENIVKINEKPENSRGKQLFNGDKIEINSEKYIIEVWNCI